MIAIRDNLSGGVSRCKQVSNLAVTVGFSTAGTIVASWINPTDTKYKGVRILYKTGGYPTAPTDGNVFYDSNDAVPVSTFTKSGFVDGTRYYLRAFAYTYKNATRLYTLTEQGAQANGVPLQVKGQQIFTSSGTFIVPAGVTNLDVFLVGGGGGSGIEFNEGGSGAGGGYANTFKNVSVIPGTQWNVLVGAGGLNANGAASSFSYGSQSYSAQGGARSGKAGGAGGSGGGGGGQYAVHSGNGGSDGSDGLKGTLASGSVNDFRYEPGKGQGSTTRAFGESDGTLYSGGGGGAWSPTGYTGSVGQGGAGGGGRGQETRSATNVATGGTPNTGGGAGGHYQAAANGQGGSGIVIVRWGY